MASSSALSGVQYTCYQYGEHELQQVAVWQYASRDCPKHSTGSSKWIIYIHGGAWRDPARLSGDFIPSIKHILESKEISDTQIAGFASIDYRLSPHPDFPQDSAVTPVNKLRAAKHPEHIQDVGSAISFLNAKYAIGNEYILVGHSAGATLAHQLLMGNLASRHLDSSIPFPTAIIGIAGIYDLVGLNERHDGYDGFISGAFTSQRDVWKMASPASYDGNFKTNWENDSHLVILAASSEDTLIDMTEVEVMAQKHREDGINLVTIKSLTGDHEVVWEDGSQIAELVALAFSKLKRN